MSSPLRILHIVPSISLVYGGPSQMVLGLSQALAAAGVEVTILTTNTNGDEGQTPLEVPLGEAIIQDGYRIIYFPCWPQQRYKVSPQLWRWFWQHTQDFDIAHIHACFSPVSTIAAAIARHHHLPYIIRPLGTLDPADLRKKRILKLLYGWLLERPNLQKAAAVHFTSRIEAEVSRRFAVKTNDIILPIGVADCPPSTSPKAKETDPENPRILFMSRLDAKKGLDLLIPCLETLHQQGQKFHFVLAGDNPQNAEYVKYIRQWVNTSEIGKHTIMPGFVRGEYKQYLLRQADLMVLPSAYENFGIVVAEAMMAGVPVLISDQVYIWQEVLQAEAGWVCQFTLESLLEQFKLALADAQERQRRGENAQKFAWHNYRWPAIATQSINIYKTLINKVSNFSVFTENNPNDMPSSTLEIQPDNDNKP